MVLRIILSAMLIIPFIVGIGLFFLFNIGNEIREKGRERALVLEAKREKREIREKQEIMAQQERFFRT